MNFQYFLNDLPDNLSIDGDIAVDTESMGLTIKRDRLCVVQIADSSGNIYIVHFPKNNAFHCKNLKLLLSDDKRQKIFHFGRFDIAILQYYLQIQISNIFCTKIASKLARTYTDYHGLKELCNSLLGVKISKQQQSSDWGADTLTEEQLQYAASDVLYLHKIRDKLRDMLLRENKLNFAMSCFAFLNTVVNLDLNELSASSIFEH
ncbi:MAG: ribonuclease D [Proteobacteria bacterium]|nr:ribonuclease D [Pseudomonadota bacterium]